MTKGQLIQALVNKCGITKKDAKLCVDTVFDCMANGLTEGRIEIRGFATFKVKEYKPYKGRNPKTGAVIECAGKKLPIFKMSAKLKNRINKDAQINR